jgi:hypothetical protein
MRPTATLWSSRFALILPIAAACGGAVVGVGPGGGGEDAGIDSGNCGGGGAPEPVCCGVDQDGCRTIVGDPTCGPNGWTCLVGEASGSCGPICSVDAGGPGDASFGDGSFGDGSFGDASFGDASFGDGGFGDAGFGDSSAGDGGIFACGPQGLTCNGATQYCYIEEGGVVLPDGGSNVHASCMTIPAACQGSALSCICIQDHTQSEGTFCQNSGGDVTLTFAAP